MTAASSSLAILADQADRAVARQAVRVDEHRARAATLFSAAAVAGAFLGAEAFKDPKGPGPWAWAGAILLAIGGVLLAYVVWPRTWAFVIDVPSARDRVKSGNLSADQTSEALITGLWNNYRHNEPKLRFTSTALGVMGILVVLEIAALFINLAAR